MLARRERNIDDVYDSVMKELIPKSLLASFGDVVGVSHVGGGCISTALKVDVKLADGDLRQFFVKFNDESFLDNFQCEAAGLQQLAESKTIGVPTVTQVTELQGRSWFVADWVDQSPADTGFFQKFGSQLAELHRSTLGDQCGWHKDNHLGAAKQKNLFSTDWPSFFAELRIEFQLHWAVNQGLSDSGLRSDCQKIISQMRNLLSGRDKETSLLHGDLWSGNYMCDADGEPVVIDPAVYRGCREAEFGMIRLFGSCPASFYDAYNDAFPMRSGWQRRVDVYVLYHLLNHLNLFGGGYLSQCKSLASQILRAS